MPPVAINDIVMVTIESQAFSQRFLTTFHYKVTNVGTAFNPVLSATVGAADFAANALAPYPWLKLCMSPQVVINRVRMQWLKPLRYAPGTFVTADPGTNIEDTTSTNQSAVVTRACDLSGRKYVGSIHVPAVSQANLLNGLCKPAYKAQLDALAGSLLNTLTLPTEGLVIKPVLYNRTGPVFSTDITRAFAQDTARVMRRRTVGLGI
jgi:hypothetical protein